MVKVKICGITNLEDALAAVEAGADALGFVFFRKSPRYIPPEKAAGIIRRLPRAVVCAGVFVNARERTIRRISAQCGLGIIQLHGSESPGFCARFKGTKVVKAFRVRGNADVAKALCYGTTGYLFDSFIPGAHGGTGKCFDWSVRMPVAGTGKEVFLSGGLTAVNVREAIRRFRPQWVDVSTGVEAAPGKKDARKIRDFIRAARRSRGRS